MADIRNLNEKHLHMTQAERELLAKQCKDGEISPILVLRACKRASESLAGWLFSSLVCGISADKFEYIGRLPINRVDFYAYKRIALAHLKALMQGEPFEQSTHNKRH